MSTSTDVQIPAPVGLPSPSITAEEFALASRSEATRKAYKSDWAVFTSWCADNHQVALPASPATVAAFLAAQASAGFAPATLSRRLGAINAAHRLAGHPSPTTSEAVSLVMKGIRRTVGVSQRQARPLVVEDLKRVVATIPDTLVGVRDRALVLLGFAGAFRRSELVAIAIEDLNFSDGGVLVTIRRSKTDQEGQGREVGIPFGQNGTCPVSALRAWLHAANITSGPVFRRIDQHGHIGPNALQPAAVAQIVKKAVEGVGLDPAAFSGHSLRAGLATSAAQNGANELTIMATTGHKSSQMVRRYVRRANLFKANAATVAGL
jgi:integrase